MTGEFQAATAVQRVDDTGTDGDGGEARFDATIAEGWDIGGNANGGYWLIDWLIVAPMLAASVYAAIRLRPSYAVYLWGAVLIPLTFAFAPRPLMSMPRFLLPLFPAFWGLALGIERLRIPRAAVLSAGAVGLGVLSLLTVNWYYVF